MVKDEFEDEYLYAESNSEEAEEKENSLEDDGISPEEEGFMKGYEEANEEEEETENEEEVDEE